MGCSHEKKKFSVRKRTKIETKDWDVKTNQNRKINRTKKTTMKKTHLNIVPTPNRPNMHSRNPPAFLRHRRTHQSQPLLNDLPGLSSGDRARTSTRPALSCPDILRQDSYPYSCGPIPDPFLSVYPPQLLQLTDEGARLPQSQGESTNIVPN